MGLTRHALPVPGGAAPSPPPFIMAGNRIAAVASVGTMTIAAFAGAKGLGWFINLGLNSLNVEMILLGAVPVSLLALLFDFIFAKLEQAVTSEGLLPNEQIQNPPKRVIRRRQVIAVGVCVALVVVAIGGGLSNKKSEKHITVGSANFTEVYIVGNTSTRSSSEAKTDIEVDTTFNSSQHLPGDDRYGERRHRHGVDRLFRSGVSPLCWAAAMNTDPDDEVKGYPCGQDEERLQHRRLRPPGLQQHLYAMSVRPEIAEQYQLETLTDLMAVST
ncbi:MAG: ABC transporter permease/substrate-binding protein [Flavonifractor plautii]